MNTIAPRPVQPQAVRRRDRIFGWIAIAMPASISLRNVFAAMMLFAGIPAHTSPAPTPAEVLQRLHGLIGEWEGKFANGRVHRVSYRLTAAGTVLVESWALAPGRESLTLYHLDGAELIATHYCPLGNQPTLRMSNVRDDAYAFEFRSATNLSSPNDAHQHAFTIRLLSTDRFERSETYKEGQEAATEVVEYARIATH